MVPHQPFRLISAAAIIAMATMASRVTGLFRDIFLAALLGAGPFAEIFVIAFRLPNLFRRLFAEGAFNAAFVPLFADHLQRDGLAGARAFAARVLAVLLAALVLGTLLAQIFMPALVLALAQGFAGSPEKFDLAVHYARISFPYLIFMSLLSLYAAMLNALNRFLAAALAPVLLNLVLIGAMALAVWQAGAPIDYVIWGVVLAGVVQFAFVFAAAWRAGLRLPLQRPRLGKDVRVFLVLIIPGVLAAGIGQVNLLVGTSIATGQQGAAVWLYYADRLYQLPMGVIGVAISVALLPELSRRLAARDETGARGTQDMAVLASMAVTLPAAIGLTVLAMPVTSVLFERGAFDPADTHATARAAQFFCLGLPAFVLIRALQPSFFARHDTRTPLIDGAIGVVVNIAISLTLFPVYGHVAIALATSVAGWVTLVCMLVRLWVRRIWGLRWSLVRQLLAQLAAAGLMGAVLFTLMARFGVPTGGGALMLWLAVQIALGTTVFFASALLLGGISRAQLQGLRRFR